MGEVRGAAPWTGEPRDSTTQRKHQDGHIGYVKGAQRTGALSPPWSSSDPHGAPGAENIPKGLDRADDQSCAQERGGSTTKNQEVGAKAPRVTRTLFSVGLVVELEDVVE